MDDFKSVVLPNIYEELFLLDSFDYRAVTAIGAVVDGVPVAALIGQITAEAEAKVHSIYISMDYRRMGIATELLNRFLSICNQELDPTFGDEDNLVAVMVSAEYSLPQTQAKAFEGFLYAYGFRLFDEKANVYYFESGQLNNFGKKEDDVFCFADIEGTNENELFDYFDSMNITGERVDVGTDSGFKKAVSYGVMSTPTVIFFSPEGSELKRCHSVEEIKSFCI